MSRRTCAPERCSRRTNRTVCGLRRGAPEEMRRRLLRPTNTHSSQTLRRTGDAHPHHLPNTTRTDAPTQHRTPAKPHTKTSGTRTSKRPPQSALPHSAKADFSPHTPTRKNTHNPSTPDRQPSSSSGLEEGSEHHTHDRAGALCLSGHPALPAIAAPPLRGSARRGATMDTPTPRRQTAAA